MRIELRHHLKKMNNNNKLYMNLISDEGLSYVSSSYSLVLKVKTTWRSYYEKP